MDDDRWVLTDSERELLRGLEAGRLAELARAAELETEALRGTSRPATPEGASPAPVQERDAT